MFFNIEEPRKEIGEYVKEETKNFWKKNSFKLVMGISFIAVARKLTN